MKGALLFVGSKPGMVSEAKELGYRVHLIDYLENTQNADEYILLDQKDGRDQKYDLKDFAHLITGDLKGIVVSLESFVILGAQLRERFRPDLNGLTIEQAKIVRDKWLLKAKLKEFNIPTTRVSVVNSSSDFNRLKLELGIPFLMKPRSEVLAIGISIIRDEGQWSTWFEKNTALFEQYFAEEYIQNITEYCCDTLVANGEIIAQFPGEYLVNCLDSNNKQEGFGVNFPGFLPESKIEEMKIHTQDFIKKLGIKNAFCHTEFLFDGTSWLFGEIGVRMPGGLQLPTESLIANTSITKRYISLFIESLSTDSKPLTHINKYAGYYLFPKKVGVVTQIENNLSALPWVSDSKVFVQVGDKVDKEDTSVSMAAYAIYTAQSLEELKIHSQEIAKAVTITMA